LISSVDIESTDAAPEPRIAMMARSMYSTKNGDAEERITGVTADSLPLQQQQVLSNGAGVRDGHVVNT
jgi:hypothetical protein